MSSDNFAEGNDLSPEMIAYQGAVKADFPRNVASVVSWEFLWGISLPFGVFATMAPAYLNALGASKALIGVVLSIPNLAAAVALLMSYWIRPHVRLATYKIAIIGSLVPYFLYSATSAWWGGAWPNALHIALYVSCMAVFVGAAHSLAPTFWAIMTDITPVRRRGRLAGFRMVCLSAGGLLVSYAAFRLFETVESPLNFRIGFVIASSICLTSCLCVFFMRDHVSPSHRPYGPTAGQSLWSYLKDTIRHTWGDPNYRILLFFYALFAATVTGTGFIVAAAKDQLNISPERVAFFATVTLAGGVVLGWVPGVLADRFGYRAVGAMSSLIMAGGFLTCLLARDVVIWYVAYGTCTAVSMSQYAILCNMGAEIRPDLPANRLMASGLAISLVFVVTTNTLCGALRDFTHLYVPSFVVYIVLGLVAALGFAFVVREPRTGRMYMIKPLSRP